MKSKRTLALVLALMGGGISPSQAGVKTGADFLKIPIGARSIGMGQAYSALAENADALTWNTAGIVPGLGNLDSAFSSLSLSHQEMFFGNNLDHMAFAMPMTKFSVGLSVTRLSYPDQEARDADRNNTGSFGASDLSMGAAFGMRVSSLRLGTQIKYIKQDLADAEASGFAMDLGLLSPTPISKLSMGAAVQNLGPSLQFVQEDYALPLTLALGFAYRLKNPLTLALDVRNQPRDHQTSLSIGTEFAPRESIMLRAGYLAKLASAITNSQQDETNRGTLGGMAGINAGFGIKMASFSLDYAISPFGELGNVQSFTLSSSFGGSSRKLPQTIPVEEPKSEETSKEEDRKIIILDQPKENETWMQK